MNPAAWLNALLPILERHALLSRLFFASVEFAALALAVGLIITVFRLRQPRLRALLWLVVLAKPLVGLAVGTPLPLLAITLAAPAPSEAAEMTFVLVQGEGPLVRSGAPVASFVVNHTFSWSAALPLALLSIWLVGVALFALRLILSERRIGRIIRQSSSPSPWLADRLAAVSRRMGLAWVPPCRVTPSLESPALVGFWHPVILLPEWVSVEADPLRVEWSLRHELMHWRLRDPLAALVCELARTLFFFHPAAWWAGRRWQEATEMACDRALIHSVEDAEIYADELYRMLLKVCDRRRIPVAGGLFAGRTQISRRIESLLRNPLQSPAHLSAAGVGLVLIISLASLAVGCSLKTRHATPAGKSVTAVKALADPLAGLNAGQLPFDLMHADVLQYDPNGNATLTKNVRIESKKFKLSCDRLTMDNKTRTIHATGEPVKVDLPPAIQGSGRTLDYDMGKQELRLEEDAAVILEKKGGRKIKSTADVIRIEKDAQGQYKVSLMRKPGSGNMPFIESVDGSNSSNDEVSRVPIKTESANSSATAENWKKIRFEDLKLTPLDPSKPNGRMRLSSVTDFPFDAEAGLITPYPETGKFLLEGNVKISGAHESSASADVAVLELHNGRLSTRLDGNASMIAQGRNGKMMKTAADWILINVGGPDGMPTVSVGQHTGSKRKPSIQVLGSARSSKQGSPARQ